MGLRLVIGTEQGSAKQVVVMYDSTSGWAFGPTFDSQRRAEHFMVFAKNFLSVPDLRVAHIDDLAKAEKLYWQGPARELESA